MFTKIVSGITYKMGNGAHSENDKGSGTSPIKRVMPYTAVVTCRNYD